MIWKYPEEIYDYVRKWCRVFDDEELAELCNKYFDTEFTKSKMRAFRHNHHMNTGRKQWTSEDYWKHQTRWPKGMKEFIEDNSWGVSSQEMAEMVNAKFGTSFTRNQMKSFRQRYGIKSGVTGWYQKGHAPGTKGKTLEEICKHDPEKLARARSSQFKKGQMPHNTLPLGTVLPDSDGYLRRKIRMNGNKPSDRWEYIHRAVWEEHNGPIPKGMIITFLNGDRSDCRIENLALINQGENATLAKKGYRFEDPELTETAINLVRLQSKAGKIRRELNGVN